MGTPTAVFLRLRKSVEFNGLPFKSLGKRRMAFTWSKKTSSTTSGTIVGSLPFRFSETAARRLGVVMIP
jgi:hypothetical protein